MPPLTLDLLLLVLIIALGLTFDFINGFHDTANAIATAVGRGIVPPEIATQSLVIAALIAAIIWNLVTWYFGLPSSSSHALIFSLAGAGVASAGWDAIQLGGLEKTFQGLVF